jgi:hypothetical protein
LWKIEYRLGLAVSLRVLLDLHRMKAHPETIFHLLVHDHLLHISCLPSGGTSIDHPQPVLTSLVQLYEIGP